ncbi:aspartyl/asparaginyl beta-hydroxylase domain-containing protein [uncultured Prochlorococcus sp.]|uniref:aspartyl/asparaginyl beta-hydroxylase domain-containing protein n=1 Tax=uncultured Prochlorococcus sp. TaxID=159733 RepID=UPI002583497D|nr:aspartyl/asparaginyl beta-hydroxylase domain-containing protein [uncultured Prochlorococcus sp.]
MLVDYIDAKDELNLLTKEIEKKYSSFDFKRHFRFDHHTGGWLVFNIKSFDGSNHGKASSKSYKYEEVINELPSTKSFLEKYFRSARRIRLMSLKKNNSIFWHYDSLESADFGISRIHIPIKSSHKIITRIFTNASSWKPYRIYYGDFSFPHRVDNLSKDDWLHLVIDYEGDIHPFFRKSYIFKPKFMILRKFLRKIIQFICDFYCMHRGIKDIKRFIKIYFL